MSQVARKATFNLLAKGIITIFALLSLTLVAKNVNDTAVGILAFGLGFVGVLSFVSDFGFASAHVKRISEGKEEAECNGTFIAIKLGLTGLMVLVIVVALYIWGTLPNAYENPQYKSDYELVVYIVTAYYVLISLSQIATLTFGGRQESAKQQIPEMIGTLARAPALIWIALFAGTMAVGLAAIYLSLAYLATAIVMFVLAFALFLNSPVGRPTMRMLRSYASYALPISVLSFMGMMVTNVDKVIIKFFWAGTAGDAIVGHYFMMQRFILVYILISSSLGPILFPRLSQTHACKDFHSLREMCWKAEKYTSVIIVPLVMATIALAPTFIVVFAAESYLADAGTLIVLSVYALLLSLDMAYVMVIYCVDRPEISMRLGLITALVTLGMFVVLVPRTFFGMTLLGGGALGAAVAMLIGVVVEYVLCRHYAYKVAGVTSYHRTLYHVSAGFAMALLLYAFYWTGFVDRLTTLLDSALSGFFGGLVALSVVCLIGLAVYAGLLWATGELKREDLRFFKDLLNVGKMREYLSSELRQKK
jgi:O-antigen/teichoic acid export membrane protein